MKTIDYEFKGLIALKSTSDSGDGIYIIPDTGWFTSAFANDFPTRAKVNVRYAINSNNNWPDSLDEVAANEIAKLEGLSESEFYDRYSDLTGYLWTEERAKVGGHDLIKILGDNVGKYLWMEVEAYFE